MKKLYFFCFLLLGLAAQTVSAQSDGTLTGTVQDESGTPLGFATVSVVRVSDTTVVTGGVSEANGQFRIASPVAGTYRLRITALSYARHETAPFTVTGPSFTKAFGNMLLKAEARQLKGVTVQALRPTITQETDRLVVGVEGTALAAGRTAYDVLSRSPGVFIDPDGNIQLNGRGGVTIMLNGKLTYLSARDLRNMLESMSAENIKSIEIITNPSAKYDAEGASGILNINLKKNERYGTNGSVYAGYVFNGKQHGYSSGGTINYKSGPWNSSLILDLARRVGGRDATFTRVFKEGQKTTYFDQVAVGNYVVQGPPSARLSTDYSFNDRHSLGGMVNYTTNMLRSDFLTETYLSNTPRTPVQFIDADNFTDNRFENLTTNLHYVGKLDTLGTTLSADVDFARIRNRGESNFYNYYYDLTGTRPATQDFLYTDLPSGFDIYSAKIDYVRAFSKRVKLEMGAKTSRVLSDNDSRFYFNNGEVPVLDPRRTNHFVYQERIHAAYLSGNGPVGRKFTVQAGLRVEQTQSFGNLLTTGQETRRNYIDWFPSVFIQQKVSDQYQINYNYSRRIQRPNYGNLNPFIIYRDPYTFIRGNPYLRPQYAHAFSVTQTFRKTYNLTFQYQLTQDVIAELIELDVENATTLYYTGNVDNYHNAGLTAILPVKLAKNWETTNTLIGSYNQYNNLVNGAPVRNEQVFFMAQSNHTLQMPWGLRLELNGAYRGPTVYALYRIKGIAWLHLGLKKSFLKNKLDVNVNINDVFKSQRTIIGALVGENVSDFDQYFRNRTMGLTLRYHFTKGAKFELRRRNTNLDELNRTGN